MHTGFLKTGIFLLLSVIYVSCRENKRQLFQKLSSKHTGITFKNSVTQTESFNVLTYPYLYNGGGAAVIDVNNDGWQDLFFTGNHKAKNKLYLNKGNLSAAQAGFQFEDITAKAGVQGKSDWCNGIAVVDINGDGWQDLYISTVTIPGLLNSANELYINNKNGTFTEAAASYGLNLKYHTTQSVFLDYDLDGDLDCFLLNHSVTYAEDYKDVSVRQRIDSASGDRLLKNENGTFKDITTEAGIYSSAIGYGLGVSAGDLNQDGRPDIYVSNDFKENDYCYINNGDGTFTERIADLFSHSSRFSMGNDMADYNNDGWPDMITMDMLSQDERIIKTSVGDDDMQTYDYKQKFGFHYQVARNCLLENVDGQFFHDLAFQKGVAATDWSWAPLFADFNNDGLKDLFISNGYKYRLNDQDFSTFFQNTIIEKQKAGEQTNKLTLVQQVPRGEVPDFLYLNQTHKFDDVSEAAGFTTPTLSNGAVYADFDNDGDLDLAVNCMEAEAGIYKNEMPLKNYLNIQLNGSSQNTLGIGTKVFVYAGGQMQLYHQSLSRGFMSSVSPLIHIGLNEHARADSILILWPDGKGQRMINVTANKTLKVQYTNAVNGFQLPVLKKNISSEWEEDQTKSGIQFAHQEDAFDDLNVQPFLPHSLATQGPKTAAADVNGDGLQDLFICGAKNQPAQLFLQTQQSTFINKHQQVFMNDSACEDVDAVFFDADKDGDADLYVASGGNEYYGRQQLLKDRLYINDGKGNYSRSVLPDLFENKSCVRVCDFDQDGDMDLFVGGRANARMYGYTPASVILQNDGKGIFKEVTESVSGGLLYAGMITDACWTDINKDGWQDLVVVGEWMPVTIFYNQKGKLVKTIPDELKNTNGWWTCLYRADVDSDGDDDFLLGNWGTNTKLTASETQPLKLFIADWDNNQEIDPILSLYRNGQEYTFLTKLDLERRLPYLKKQFFKFSDMAGKTTPEIFGKDKLDKARLLTVTEMRSSVLYNDNGKFQLKPLPDALQTAPVFSFASYQDAYGKTTYMAAGNFYEVLPYEGRYDALLPVLFQFNKNEMTVKGSLLQRGAVRKIQPVSLKNGQTLMLFVRNNAPLTVMRKSNLK